MSCIALLTPEELIRIVRIIAEEDIEEVRSTDKEPLLCPDHVDMMTAIASVEPYSEISITTNGTGLTRLAKPLKRAGLMRTSVPLDTLKPDRFHQPTHHNWFADVLARIMAASAAGLHPVKLSALQPRGIDNDEALGLLAFAVGHGCELRLIEQIPLNMRRT